MNHMIKYKKIALVSSSDPFPNNKKEIIFNLIDLFKSFNIEVVLSKFLFSNDDVNYPYCAKGTELNNYFSDSSIDGIFDVSGGDLANTILDYIDFVLIKESKKTYWGYSDLTSILNGINRLSNINTYLYQVRNLIMSDGNAERNNFEKFLLGEDTELFNFSYNFIRGSSFEGIVVGGNIRCLLKTAGTDYICDFHDKILFLESLSGKENRIRSFIAQLSQIGAFKNLRGIILGTFTELQSLHSEDYIINLFKEIIPDNIPIIKTEELGHSNNSKAIIIGDHYSFTKN